MDKNEILQIAASAVTKLVKERGTESRFPFDAIWQYANKHVPSRLRPAMTGPLQNEGYIELTGNFTRAESRDRAGSPTREYRPGPRFSSSRSSSKGPQRANAKGVATALLRLTEAVQAGGLIVTAAQIANFYLAALASPIVIMAGVSGSGKSRLPRTFAEHIGAQFTSIPVKPQWDDNSDLFGYTSALQAGTFVPGPFTNAVVRAQSDSKPNFVLLDEMNLAPVEHYFSDFLSVVETRRREHGNVTTDVLPLDLPPISDGSDKYSKLRNLSLPANVKIVGTANMDETTKTFSPKVLDRAFSIEFDEVDLTEFPITGQSQQSPNSFAAIAARLSDSKNPVNIQEAYATEASLCDEVASYFEQIRAILRPGGATFAFRPRDAACLYMWHWKQDNLAQLLPKEAALDYCILQKILPKIYGQGQRLQDALENLHHWLQGEAIEGIEADANRTFLRSAEKTERMIQRLKDEGATTYWGT